MSSELAEDLQSAFGGQPWVVSVFTVHTLSSQLRYTLGLFIHASLNFQTTTVHL